MKGNTAFSNDDAKGYFLNEKAAMFLTATWELPNFTTSPDVPKEFKEKVGYFKFPLYEGGKGTDVNSYVGQELVFSGTFEMYRSNMEKKDGDSNEYRD